MLPSSSMYFSSVRVCRGMSGRLSACKRHKTLAVGSHLHSHYAQSTDVKEHFAINPTVINNSQLQQISVFQVRLKTVLTIAEYQCHYGSIQVIHSAAFLFQCTSITSSNKRKKNPNGDTTTCVEQSVEIQIYLKKQAKKTKM